MNSAYASVVVRFTAAAASIATTFTLLSAVISLSEPQHSQLIAAVADRGVADSSVGRASKPDHDHRPAVRHLAAQNRDIVTANR